MLTKFVNDKKGFTLIELMIVIAIIGILAAIAIPQFASYRERGTKSTAVSDAKNIANLIETYFSDNQSFPPTASLPDANTVVLSGQTFSLSKNNMIKGYTALGPNGYTFAISNTQYNKSVTYNSTAGGLNPNVWPQ